MSKSQNWKNLERRTAAALGGRRNPASKGLGGPDVEGVPGWVLECKHRATLAIDSLFRSERKKRQKELRGKRFALIVQAKGYSPLAVITLDDFQELLEEARSGLQEGPQCVLSFDEE